MILNRKLNRVSTRNNAYQHLEVVKRNRAKRTKFGEIVVQGVQPINLCVSSGIRIKQVYFTDYDGLSPWAMDLIENQPQADLYQVAPGLMAEISDRDDGSELILIAQQPEHNVDQMPLNRILILDRPSSPGNFGAIVRTCSAFSIEAIFISGHGIDPYDPKSIAASRGALFVLPLVKLQSNGELEMVLAKGKRTKGFTVYGSSAKLGVDLRTETISDRFALIIGNETSGMTAHLKGLADIILKIPIHGEVTSLNAACATSILVYELTGLLTKPEQKTAGPDENP